jgi:pyrroline-5-carboxylate reductase
MTILACIGSGSMGHALMKSVPYSGDAAGIHIFFTDIESSKAIAAAASIGAEVFYSNIEAVEKAEYVFFAIRPQILQHVLAEISLAVKKRITQGTPPVLVSMAAGWSIEKIQTAVDAKIPVVRIMPNTPALIGRGMIVLTASQEVSAEKIETLEKLLSGAGIVDRLDERYMDAVTGLSGSGPAFTYLFIEALADGGVRAGLPRDKALCYAAQTVLGSAAMVIDTGKHPGELKDMVTSPGGTTIAGLAALEDGAFRGTVIKAVEAAWERSVELGK